MHINIIIIFFIEKKKNSIIQIIFFEYFFTNFRRRKLLILLLNNFKQLTILRPIRINFLKSISIISIKATYNPYQIIFTKNRDIILIWNKPLIYRKS